MLPHPDLSVFVERSGAVVEPAATEAAMRYVWTGNRLVGLPASPAVLAAPFVSVRAKLRAALEPFVPARRRGEDAGLADFLISRFGPEMGRFVATVAASGVYAGDPDRLSARSAFPAIASLADESGSLVRGAIGRVRHRERGRRRPTSHIAVDGMDRFVAGLLSHDRIATQYECGVAAVSPDGGKWRIEGSAPGVFDQVVVAASPDRAKGLLAGELGSALSGFVSAPVAVVFLAGPASGIPLPPGFGVLVGPDSDHVGVGTLFESSYAPSRTPAGVSLAKVIAGGARHPRVVDWDDATLVTRVGEELARIIGNDIDVDFVRVVRHRPGIPQYEIGHQARLERLAAVRPPGLHFAGWAYRGVGITHLAADARSIADVIETESVR